MKGAIERRVVYGGCRRCVRRRRLLELRGSGGKGGRQAGSGWGLCCRVGIRFGPGSEGAGDGETWHLRVRIVQAGFGGGF